MAYLLYSSHPCCVGLSRTPLKHSKSCNNRACDFNFAQKQLLPKSSMTWRSTVTHNEFQSVLPDLTAAFNSLTLQSFRFAEIKSQSGVPNGTVLAPLLFNLYMFLLGTVIKNHDISWHSYADDPGLYLSFFSDDLTLVHKLIPALIWWLPQNVLELNRDKTENLFIFIHFYETLWGIGNLGIILDCDLSFYSSY